jgi:hypothetical protein
MKINFQKDPYDEDAWICFCGNTPFQEGFYPCNSEGEIVEPISQDWTTGWYVCDRCGRIIDQATREIVGVRFENTLTKEEREAIFSKG